MALATIHKLNLLFLLTAHYKIIDMTFLVLSLSLLNHKVRDEIGAKWIFCPQTEFLSMSLFAYAI